MLLISALLCSAIAGTAAEPQAGRYGVFVGLDPDRIEKLYDYDTVIIDASFYSKKEIKKLRQRDIKVYSYINIGSVETFRSYYKRFEPRTLGDYEGWPDERWMDVADAGWQKYIGTSYAKKLKDKGVDGYFVDNCDVYDVYQTDRIYKGLKKILNRLNKQQLPIIINGGDTFMKKILKAKSETALGIAGVNQENVFSAVEEGTEEFKKQSKPATKYYKEYLTACKKHNLQVFLTEYVKPSNKKLRTTIKKYCEKKGYNYYISSSLSLS
jgi:hypothetical protein